MYICLYKTHYILIIHNNITNHKYTQYDLWITMEKVKTVLLVTLYKICKKGESSFKSVFLNLYDKVPYSRLKCSLLKSRRTIEYLLVSLWSNHLYPDSWHFPKWVYDFYLNVPLSSKSRPRRMSMYQNPDARETETQMGTCRVPQTKGQTRYPTKKSPESKGWQ